MSPSQLCRNGVTAAAASSQDCMRDFVVRNGEGGEVGAGWAACAWRRRGWGRQKPRDGVSMVGGGDAGDVGVWDRGSRDGERRRDGR